MASPSISIIIPVYNESVSIIKLLEYLNKKVSSFSNIAEIILVDGGSIDDTCDTINSYIATKNNIKTVLLNSLKGRAKQMNLGAANSAAPILYFLHADSYPPQDFDKHIIEQVDAGNTAGCFRMKFNSNHWWLRLAGWFTQFKWRACRGGDQSQFITRDLFEAIGTYNEQFIIYEDNDLISKLYARNQYTVIQKWLTTSARKYEENGVWRLQYHFFNIHLRKLLGATPEDLHHYYQKKVS